MAVVIVFGLIFLGSSSAFNAIVSSSVVALDLSYAMPIAVNCLQGRNRLPHRPWRLPRGMGWIVDTVLQLSFCVWDVADWNEIALAYIALTTVLFLFPPKRPVTGSNMSMSLSLEKERRNEFAND